MGTAVGGSSDHQDADAGPETGLRARSLTLPGVLMQALAHMAPAVGMLAFIPMITAFSGVTSPLAYLIAFLIVLTLGVSLVQLAKHLPAAGGYYTYVSRTVHPRAGFLAAWMFFLIEVLAPGAGLGFGGIILQETLKAEYGVAFPWWLFLIIATALIAGVSYFGVRIAVGVAVVLGILEVAIVGALALFVLTDPGPGGINLSPFNPGNSISTGGLSLAVVFAIFAFAGFESVAPLAEETKNPRRVLPRAIMASLIITGTFYVFTGWAFLVGWGTEDVAGFVGSAENPIFILARQQWGAAWFIVFLVLINSILAIGLAASNAATRVMYATARSGALPSPLAKVHPTHQTPVNAIFLQAAVTLVFGLGLGFAVGPLELFFTVGLAATLS
ncbi:MAG: APC family permease, partial [Actinomycetota bacterium]|nr:APC family permease [Actinomycetota bacterium]